jgi:hypothetical protein
VPSGAKRRTVGDNGPGGVPGPELRLTANGARARAISRRIGGAQRRFTIEGSARMGLADARRAAVALPSTLDAGTAPTAERRAARTRAALVRIGIGRAWTLGQLIDGYGAKVAMPARERPWLARRDHMRREYRDLLDSPVAALDAGAFWHPLDAATYLQNLTHTTAAGGAGLLWRVKSNLRPPRETALADGSSPTMIHASPKERRHRVNGRRVRVVECRLEGPAAKEPLQRLMTTILRAFPSRPPASTRPLPSAS